MLGRSLRSLPRCFSPFLATSLPRTGHWQKTAKHSHEVRGLTLGVVGYGRIGSQVSILAEAFGMHVIYYDVLNPILSLGNAEPVESLEELLKKSDIVITHTH